ncbi:hypothetical protein GCM10020256_09350 [Streptomyces thermocoprophilus]
MLLLVIAGPLTARWTEPLARRITRRGATPDHAGKATDSEPTESAHATV